MPKVDMTLLDDATSNAVGSIWYTRSESVKDWEKVKKLSGITKGQWKRFQYSIKRRTNGDYTKLIELRASELTIKKLLVMSNYGGSEHLPTLLKMIEARTEEVDT